MRSSPRRTAKGSVAEAEGVTLPDVVDPPEVRRGRDGGEPLEISLALQHLLELEVAVEVILQRALAASGDEQDVLQSGLDRLLHHVLDGGLVDDGEHLLGRGLGRRQEAGAEAGSGDHGLAHDGRVRHD
jgi:hypothetical protein